MNVLITGASQGIGEALAREFARRGAKLGLIARNAEKLRQLAATLPGQPLTYSADVTNKDQLIAACKQFEQDCGGADIVIANAGISIGVRTEYYEDLAAFADILNTNVLAMATTFHSFIEPMRARKRGTLVGIASVAGTRGLPGSGAYCCSKAAAISYCESLRVEMQRDGVKVVTVAPGFIKTNMTGRNPYKMPFLMEVDAFAKAAADTILAGTSFKVIPWQMGWVARLLKVLPNAIFDRATANRAHKPRRGEVKSE
jgi:short-subunit dehydrogenase